MYLQQQHKVGTTIIFIFQIRNISNELAEIPSLACFTLEFEAITPQRTEDSMRPGMAFKEMNIQTEGFNTSSQSLLVP